MQQQFYNPYSTPPITYPQHDAGQQWEPLFTTSGSPTIHFTRLVYKLVTPFDHRPSIALRDDGRLWTGEAFNDYLGVEVLARWAFFFLGREADINEHTDKRDAVSAAVYRGMNLDEDCWQMRPVGETRWSLIREHPNYSNVYRHGLLSHIHMTRNRPMLNLTGFYELVKFDICLDPRLAHQRLSNLVHPSIPRDCFPARPQEWALQMDQEVRNELARTDFTAVIPSPMVHAAQHMGAMAIDDNIRNWQRQHDYRY